MNQKVRQHLIDLAHKKRTITYQDLSNACGLRLVMQDSENARPEIGRVLGEIFMYEHNAGRPLISVLVITKRDQYQGDGFYKLCEQLGYGPWRKLIDDIAFEIGLMNACFNFWADRHHYKWYR